MSPGVRLGYVFGEGFSWNTEISIGFFNEFDAKFYSIGMGHQKIRNIPNQFTYFAIQGGQELGWSVGRVYYKEDGLRKKGWRISGFGGVAIGFLSSYQLILPSHAIRYHTIGISGKLPVPFALINKNIGLVNF